MKDLDAEGGRLLAPLREMHPTPGGVDVAAAVRRGRRRYHVMRVAQMGGAVGLTAVVAATATLVLDERGDRRPNLSDPLPSLGSSAPCTVSTLPSPVPGAHTVATAVDPTGRFVVGRADEGSGWPGRSAPSHAVIWDNGTPSVIASPGGFFQLDAVNSSGVAVGAYLDTQGEWVAAVYRDGAVTRLSGGMAARWIGAQGRIAGLLSEPAGGGIAVWATPYADPTRLSGIPAGWMAHINSIAADGTVVGVAEPPAVQHTPQDVENSPRGLTSYLWHPDGTVTTLPMPTLAGRKVVGFRAVTLDGDRVFGSAVVEGSPIESRWIWMDISTGTATEYAADAQLVDGQQANVHGWFPGSTGRHPETKPAIATPTGRLDLPVAPGFADQVALGANENGTVIVGNGHDPATQAGQALIWSCRR